LLGIEPEAYTVEDLYSIAAYMAYTFAFSLRTDPLVDEIYHKLGPAYLRDLDLALVGDPFAADTAVSDTLQAEMMSAFQPQVFLPEHLPVPSLKGSNNWAIAPSRTLSSEVIFANDTHIKYASPAAWYEAHLEYPGFSFYGNFMAGIPVALIGHSREHAWGLTMFEDDDSDFFIEKLTADRSESVYLDSLTAPVNVYEEKILIEGGSDTTITVYETVNGPIVNEFLPVQREEPISMYWNYLSLENKLLQAFYRMNLADNIDEFRKGVAMIGSPGLNVAYGDAYGNIALWSASRLIRRPETVDGKRFARGFAAEDQYQGFHPFEENPQVENPVTGLVLSANQMHDSIYGLRYPGYYAPDTRADRISKILERTFPASVDSIKSLSLDVVSETEAAVAKALTLSLRRANKPLNDADEAVLNILGTWDGGHELNSTAPTVHYKWLHYVLKFAMEDELTEEHFKALLNTHLIKRSYPKLLDSADSPWWDNIYTEEIEETREDIVLKAFRRAMNELTVELGNEPGEWYWEKVHFVEHPHPFSKSSILKPLWHVGPFPAPGGVETVNNSGFNLNGDGKYVASNGPAMRIIIDFGDVENAVSILPTGNSGNVMSPHYNDQAEMYVKGEFRRMLMNQEEIQSLSNKVIFTPEM
jgi:penicillin amidase